MEGVLLPCECRLALDKKTKQGDSHSRQRLYYSQSLDLPLCNYFPDSSDSSQWLNTPNTKTNPLLSLEVKHSISKDSLLCNSCWVQEELRTTGLQSTQKIEDGDFGVEKRTKKVKGSHYTAQHYKEERVLFLSKNDGRKDDTGEALYVVDSLKFHTKQKDLCRGSQIHADIVQKGLLDKNVFIGCTLVNMYAKCGALEKAHRVFDDLPVRNVVSWNALITGYTQHGHCKDALNCYEHMHLENCIPNAVTFACILNACGSIKASAKGQDIHARIIKAGLVENDIVLANALVDMYAKCGSLAKGREVLEELPTWDVVSYTALIVGYAQQGSAKEVFNCYKRMQNEGVPPNIVTFAGILKVCGSVGAGDKGQEIHAQVVIDGLLEKDILVGTAVLDMYVKCGSLVDAQDVFDELLVHDVVSWNALIAGYAQYEYGEEALDCLGQMQAEGLSPNTITFACILKSCGSIGATDKGEDIHSQIVKVGLLDKTLVGTGLVYMYANCGMLREAQEMFEKLPVRNVVSWSALMVGYAQLGKDEEVFNLFNSMMGEGTKPDSVIVTIVLNTCSHQGLLDKGQLFFEILTKVYGIFPTLEHHTCMVDLFSRAGHFDESVTMIKEMPFSGNLTVWHILLGACRKWENVKLGRWAFEVAVQLDQMDAEAYACMRNIYN